MKYRTLLFDADDTLLDFQAAEHTALSMLFSVHGLVLTEEIRMLYSAYNQSLWKRLEQGELSREELLKTRFAGFFSQIGVTADGAKAEEEYRGYLACGTKLVAGAKEVCATLAQTHTLCIITNGISNTQRRRLRATGMEHLFRKIFISQDVGYSKPDPGFFRAVFRALPEADPTQTLIIGDSLTSDIQGGVNFGIDTCWFCPSGQPEIPPVEPTWRIESLQQLLTIAEMP